LQQGIEITFGDGENKLISKNSGVNSDPSYLGIHNHQLFVSSEKTEGDNTKKATVIQVIKGVTRTIIIVEYAGFQWRVKHNDHNGNGTRTYKVGDTCYILFPEDKLILIDR